MGQCFAAVSCLAPGSAAGQTDGSPVAPLTCHCVLSGGPAHLPLCLTPRSPAFAVSVAPQAQREPSARWHAAHTGVCV